MLENFYRIIDQTPLSNEPMDSLHLFQPIEFTLQLNPLHHVYNGHFPGNPVVPGVCQIQIIKELVSKVMQRELRFFKSDTIKFLVMIVPAQNPEVKVRIEIKQRDENEWDVISTIANNSLIFIKFKGGFKLSE